MSRTSHRRARETPFGSIGTGQWTTEAPAIVCFRGEADMDLIELRGFPSRLTQSGHERVAFAAMHGPDLLYLTRDPWPWGKPHEAAGVHRTFRQRL